MTFLRNRFFIAAVILLLCVVLPACQEASRAPQAFFAAAAAPTATYTPFQALSPTPRPTVTVTPSPMPSPTPEPCLAEAGRIEMMEQSFGYGSLSLPFRVYTPPCYGRDPKVRYPVLYMIHGQTFADDQWERLGIGPAADALIHEGKAPPFIIVMPRERDTFADIYLSAFSRNILDGLIPWVDANYPTCTERACRAIGGLSRGGAWALHLGFTHWQMFGAIGLHSTPPFNTDPGLFPIWVRDIPADQLPRVWMDTGRRDAFLTNTSAFEAQLLQYNVPHEWYLFNGQHEEAYWSAHVSDYLEWYSKPWKDMPESLRIH